MLDALILRQIVVCATASPNAKAAELIPVVRRRVGAAPLVVLHLIRLLGDDMTPGSAVRVRTAQSDG
jgi:hypothetical protein